MTIFNNCLQVSSSVISFVSKIHQFEFPICHLTLHHDTKLFGWKKKNKVYPYEFQCFKAFKYVRRCVNTHVF